MIRSMRLGPAVVLLSVVLASDLSATRAHADERAECARAYEQSQRLQQSGENRKALAAAERCAQPTCPALLAEECKPWVTQIQKQLSRIEVHVIASDACPAREVSIEIDRVKVAQLGATFVDPGIHEVRVVESTTHRIADKTINATPGDLHLVELGFASDGAACSDPVVPRKGGGPKVAVGLGIVGGALLLTGVVLGGIGAAKRSDLDACKPGCSNDEIDGARSFFVAGDVIGGLGILTLGAATAAFFLGRGDPDTRSTSLRVVPRGLSVRF
jgi:hypothetical protein